jgi:hypothetical protein
VLAGAAATAALTLFVARGESAAPAARPTPIVISSTVPTELNAANGGAPRATLDQAAAFAWQEFIALNWPAMTHTTETPVRDTPDTSCAFGAIDGRCGSQPLVWETFRGKAEIYTAGARQNYAQPPTYSDVYRLYPNGIPPCSGAPSASPAWVNLDETSEIDLNSMYAGVGLPDGIGNNSVPQLIRFAAKANHVEFNYVTGNPSPTTLPVNTIETKAAWRLLTPTEAASGRFHQQTVRYYEGTPRTPTAPGNQCYFEATWGLISLHIIQKTQSAPYFIFATFEQADNILNAAGQPVEDEDGNVIAPLPASSTTPATHYQDSSVAPGSAAGPPSVSLVNPAAGYCTTGPGVRPSSQLYYQNEADTQAVPNAGYICVNFRDHATPPTIIAANQRAHAAIRVQNPGAPWQYYKLINVQFRPMTKSQPGVPYAGPDAATYYLANSAVETNTVLQNLSGGLVRYPHYSGRDRTPEIGANSDWASQFPPYPAPPSRRRNSPRAANGMFYNVRYGASTANYNMGGCMGCHGAAQALGADFSFILLLGITDAPDAVPMNTARGVQLDEARFRALHNPPARRPSPRRR